MEDAHADLAFCRGDDGRGRSVGESGVETAAIETRTISDVRSWLLADLRQTETLPPRAVLVAGDGGFVSGLTGGYIRPMRKADIAEFFRRLAIDNDTDRTDELPNVP